MKPHRVLQTRSIKIYLLFSTRSYIWQRYDMNVKRPNSSNGKSMTSTALRDWTKISETDEDKTFKRRRGGERQTKTHANDVLITSDVDRDARTKSVCTCS